MAMIYRVKLEEVKKLLNEAPKFEIIHYLVEAGRAPGTKVTIVENEDLTAIVVYKGKATDAELLKAVSSELGAPDDEEDEDLSAEEDDEHGVDEEHWSAKHQPAPEQRRSKKVRNK
jgi:hypothetical protein